MPTSLSIQSFFLNQIGSTRAAAQLYTFLSLTKKQPSLFVVGFLFFYFHFLFLFCTKNNTLDFGNTISVIPPLNLRLVKVCFHY